MLFLEHGLLFTALGSLVVGGFMARRLLSGHTAHGRQAAVVVLLTTVFVAANWLVVTPREQIVELCRRLARLVDEGDVNQLRGHFASEFQAEGLDPEEFLSRTADLLSRVRVDHARVREVQVSFEGGAKAVATLAATCNIRTADNFSGYIPSRWELRLREAGDRWLIESIKPIPVPPFHIKSLSQGVGS